MALLALVGAFARGFSQFPRRRSHEAGGEGIDLEGTGQGYGAAETVTVFETSMHAESRLDQAFWSPAGLKQSCRRPGNRRDHKHHAHEGGGEGRLCSEERTGGGEGG